MTQLRDGRFIATEIFGLVEEKQIKVKMQVLANAARKGQIPAKQIGDRWYFDPEWFQVSQPELKRIKAEIPAEWLRKVK